MGELDRPRRGRSVTFFFDVSIPPPVAEALAKVRDDIHWAGESGMPTRDRPDEEWLKFVADQGWTAMMRDKRVRYRPGEKAALTAPGVRGAFILTTSGNSNRWEILELLVVRWRRIEEVVANETPPFIYSITRAGVRPL
jgi:hypothetical protein